MPIPKKPLILTHAQANAISRAMVELNDIGARVHVRRKCDDRIHTVNVVEFSDGMIQVYFGNGSNPYEDFEEYANQNEFFKTYGVDK